jgi:hypothetical protein
VKLLSARRQRTASTIDPSFPGDPTSAVWRAYVASTPTPSRADYLAWLAANRY